jgi:NAD(P)-dependent dehydrogenase (short-subunit alcohol dehydrogenase family)
MRDPRPLERLAAPEDIAAAIAFLASDQAQWITGDTLRVDGGSASRPPLRCIAFHAVKFHR